MGDFVRPRLRKSPDAVLSTICTEICDFGLCPSMDLPDFDGHGCDNMTVTIVQLTDIISGEADETCIDIAVAAEKRAREVAAENGPASKRSRQLEAKAEAEVARAAEA